MYIITLLYQTTHYYYVLTRQVRICGFNVAFTHFLVSCDLQKDLFLALQICFSHFFINDILTISLKLLLTCRTIFGGNQVITHGNDQCKLDMAAGQIDFSTGHIKYVSCILLLQYTTCGSPCIQGVQKKASLTFGLIMAKVHNV